MAYHFPIGDSVGEKNWKDQLKSEMVKTYVPVERKERWEDKAKELGFTRETEKGTKANLSKFVKAMVESALNEFSPPESLAPMEEVEQYRAKVRSLEREAENLRQQNQELRRREVGVSEDRILSRLSSERVKSFDDLVQELINTEGEATYQKLQTLLRKDVVEYIPQKEGYRLKGGEDEPK